MARTFDHIDDGIAAWIGRQSLFFVGTAPLAGDGHVNLSPKGPISTLAVLGPNEAAYLDLVGSGAETIAHLRENGRIVVMLCAFDGPPRIVRLHGRGEVLLPGDERFAALSDRFRAAVDPRAHRAIVHIDVARVGTSCGYGVPRMTFEGEREHQPKWVDKQLRTGGDAALVRYQRDKNAVSIDGLPAVPVRP